MDGKEVISAREELNESGSKRYHHCHVHASG